MAKRTSIEPSPDVKMMFPIKRRPNTSREELIAYWFAHHMPHTIRVMGEVGRGYIGTIYDDNDYPWDGIAQMFLDEPLQTPTGGHGKIPSDSFHEHVQPYFGWATREYIVIDGSEQLPVRPLTLGDPFPTSRSGFFKVTHMVNAKPGTDYAALYEHWLTDHVADVARSINKAGGFRYVVGLSLDPNHAPYAGMAEMYFPDRSAWTDYCEINESEGLSEWIDVDRSPVLFAQTEFVAIP